jgi:hypothetical protein
VTPADLACTIYSRLGVDPERQLYTNDGRPVRVSQDGAPIRELGSACAAVALVAVGAGEGALALALFGGALAPAMMLAAVLLSARNAKALKNGPIWLSAIAALVAGAAILWAAPELAAAPPAQPLASAAAPWIAAVIFAATLGVVALLGFGERGPFSGPKP